MQVRTFTDVLTSLLIYMYVLLEEGMMICHFLAILEDMAAGL